MHKTGKEHTALSTFCDYMNTPESKKNYCVYRETAASS